jgi:hypothetical protein
LSDTAVTYFWSLINNTGGLVLFSTDGQNVMTVEKTAAAGTYTATLRCQITQSGTVYTFTKNIVRTHALVTSASVYNPLQFNGVTYTDITSDGGAILILSINRNGTWYLSNSSGAAIDSNNWISIPTATVGDTYYVRFTRTANTGSAGSSTDTTTWLQLTSNRSVTVSVSSLNATVRNRNATYTVDISTAGTDLTIVSTSSISLNTETSVFNDGLLER